MSRELVDFHRVEEHQIAMHERLLNWARWLNSGRGGSVSPMFRQYRSNAWQWHPAEHRPFCDTLDAPLMEKTVYKLPEKHRMAVRWLYVYRCAPINACRAMGLSHTGLYQHSRDGRQMLINMLRGANS
jgi:DNA-directed RNA polymerase specialized sigma24 family protein